MRDRAPTASSSTSARTSAPASRRVSTARVAALAQILERCDGDTWLLIENSAGTGGTIGRSLEELQTLSTALDGHPRLGICLDSCHLYASGYDVTDPAAVDDARRASSTSAIGLDRLRALHVNDSATPLGSNRDRHANILEGEMGEGLGAFLAHPAFQHLARLPRGAGPRRARARRGRAPQAARAPRPLDEALQRRSAHERCDDGLTRRRSSTM